MCVYIQILPQGIHVQKITQGTYRRGQGAHGRTDIILACVCLCVCLHTQAHIFAYTHTLSHNICTYILSRSLSFSLYLSLSLSLSLARALSLSFQVTQEANQTQKPPPGRPRLEAHHVHSSLPGYVQLMQDCWSQFPHERPTTDQCVMQVTYMRRRIHVI